MRNALLREPLVHFLAIGLGLFALHALIAPKDVGNAEILVSSASVSDLVAQHRKLWGREPTRTELDALIAARVDAEILYREGLAVGLERDDAVIKRRVRQKYELISEAQDSSSPTEADLAAYLAAHPERFRAPPVLGFTQILIAAELAGSAPGIAALKDRLAAGADPAREGRPTLLPGAVAGMAADLVARDFGTDFATALVKLPEGRWEGPVASSYGPHLVRIDKRVPAAIPPLSAIRAEVERELENDRRVKARADRLASLRERYDVVIEGGTTARPAG